MSPAPVTLTETPASGSTFAGWGGECTGTASTCSVDMTSDRAVTATFTTTTSGPPPSAPTCMLKVPSTRVVARAPKRHPAQTKKVGLLAVVFGCDQAGSVKLVIKLVESVPGVRPHTGHKTSYSYKVTLTATNANGTTGIVGSGALHGTG
jgi:hypothetical protein